jgi:hypothetical protein
MEHLTLLVIELLAPIEVEANFAYATELHGALLQHLLNHVELLLPTGIVIDRCRVEACHCVATVGVLLGECNHSVAALRVDVGEDKSLYASAPSTLKSLFTVGVELLGVYV